MWRKLYLKFSVLIKEFFYRREIEIFWDAGKKDTYGIREVYRSRIYVMNGGMKWRMYSKRGHGNTIRLTTTQMTKLLEEAKGFVRNRK